jgi:hypothetical protein
MTVRTGLVPWARLGVVALAWLFAAGVVTQVFLVGLGLFGQPSGLRAFDVGVDDGLAAALALGALRLRGQLEARAHRQDSICFGR